MRFKKFKFKKVKSTNNTAIRIIRSSNFRFGMVIAETQSNGHLTLLFHIFKNQNQICSLDAVLKYVILEFFTSLRYAVQKGKLWPQCEPCLGTFIN